MSEPFLNIPEPSLPEHNLLRDAGALPQLSSGLRDRVVLNVHKQVRYGRWAEYARIAGSVLAACLLIGFVWNYRWTGRQNPVTPERSQDSVQHDALHPSYVSPLTQDDTSDRDANAKLKDEKKSQPQGGPSFRRDSIPEMRELNQMIEKLQNRQNALCGLLPYL